MLHRLRRPQTAAADTARTVLMTKLHTPATDTHHDPPAAARAATLRAHASRNSGSVQRSATNRSKASGGSCGLHSGGNTSSTVTATHQAAPADDGKQPTRPHRNSECSTSRCSSDAHADNHAESDPQPSPDPCSYAPPRPYTPPQTSRGTVPRLPTTIQPATPHPPDPHPHHLVATPTTPPPPPPSTPTPNTPQPQQNPRPPAQTPPLAPTTNHLCGVAGVWAHAGSNLRGG
jgi:hypothetical protein